MDARELQHALAEIGWPLDVDGNVGPQTRRAVADFQRGYAWAPLDADGVAGPLTRAAIEYSLANGGACCQWFTFREFASKGDGWIRVAAALAWGLDRFRERVGGPVSLVSGYRDPARNRAVGGASSSQHLYGNAADVPQVLDADEVAALGAFSGIGIVRATGMVAHVDVRHLGPNTTGGSIGDPTTWFYG